MFLAAAGFSAVAFAPAATADTAPPNPATPATVSADALPTVQINGVVWSQATVNSTNTVYAAGSFSSARPAGSAAGQNETARKNLLAYSLTTGNLITSFSHSLNAQGLVAALSPDQSRLFVGGDFTSVDGVSHGHIAEFSTATGALVSTFAPSVNSRIKSIAATNSTVYVGGSFTAVNGVERDRLAAFSTTNGALLSWAPSVADFSVAAMALSPDGSTLVVGGQFTTINGQPEPGLGAIDPVSGNVLPWAANALIQNSGNNAGINSLRVYGNQIYGTGFVFGAGGNLEGTFAADPNTGNINWVEDCHGDTYDTFAMGQVLYSVSHEHFCGNIGSFPQTDPWTFHRANAFTTYPTGTVAHNSEGDYFDFGGNPSPSQLDWYPTLTTGTATGQNQAGWSTTGNASYLALGGEFPSVNGTAQQGLVRFAIKSIAPNKVAPRPGTNLNAHVVSLSSGTARVAWQATFDQDNEALTYKVVRDGQTATPIFTKTVNSTFWNEPTMGFTDTGLTPGSTHSYRVYVYDPLNNSVVGSTQTVTIGSSTKSAYANDVLGAGASHYWRLGEASGSTGYDWAGFDDLSEQPGITHGAAGAITGDSDKASTFDGSSTDGGAVSPTAAPGPDTYTEAAWFRTTSTSGGKIIGYGNAATGDSNNYDRQVYLDNSGHVIYGVYNGDTTTLATPGAYNDGNWHQVVASLSSAGMALYVDGKRVGTNPGVTEGQSYTGYWRVGGDNLAFWPNQPDSNYFGGDIDEAAIYPTALSLAQVQQQYTDSGRTLSIPPKPADTYGKTVMADSPELYWRLDEASGATAVDSTGSGADGVYSGGISYHAPSTVTTQATGVGLNGSDGLIVDSNQVTNPTVYSEELWFNTTTTSGGKLIGFGNASSGESDSYDRHVYMLDNGQLAFGVWTGDTNIATSPNSYNDGAWHQLVATQGPDGMTLYVDGHSVATNPQTEAQAYSGYWRVGGDHVWEGSSDFFNGTADEVAIYPSELSASRVLAHYNAAAFQSPPPPANEPPVAAFSSNCTNLACSFDTTGSHDPDGNIASYGWDFGDGTTGTGATPNHTYGSGNTYHVTLTVTDNDGATNQITHDVTVSPPPNQPPVAAFSANCPNLTCTFDGTGSHDPDGTIASYAWTFGDTTTGTGATPSHTYGSANTYSVTLTVTDNQGATNAVTHTVSPVAAPTTLAKDSFNRTVSNGLGTADQGGAWTTIGTAANLSVSPGAASFHMPATGAEASAYLPGVSTTGAETDVSLTTDKAGTGGGVYGYVIGRRVSANNQYQGRIKIAGSTVSVSLSRLTGSTTEVAIGSAVNLTGLTYTPGLQLRVRLQVYGTNPTTLKLKVWDASKPEPAAFQLSTTDTTAALQKAGTVALRSYLSGSATNAPVVVKASNFQVVPAP
jgi:PKD repeat protein